MNELKESRIPGFYDLDIDERHDVLKKQGFLKADDLNLLTQRAGLPLEQANHLIENVIGVHGLPLGLALNFMVNGREMIVPMAIEEPSVVAGASYMAKLVRIGGGFHAKTTPPEMIGQIQVLDIDDQEAARQKILAKKGMLLDLVADIDPVLKRLGGGPRDLIVRVIHDSPISSFIVIHLIYDVRDAMGANAVNTACEILTPHIENISGGRVHLRILSNLADRRLAEARCTIPLETLAFENFSAEEVRDGIVDAWAFAVADPYRAATHNKGIMNGVDAVVIATGNDWRAVEAGAHAYAARSGGYTSLSKWSVDANGDLTGFLEMPLAVGIVGGATGAHPGAKVAIQLLGVGSARELAEIIVSVGLAQNLAALRALATEGIQKGHMSLHARQVAIAAGAEGDDIPMLAQQLVQENAIRIDRAEELLKQWRNE